ncbi:MAG: hypothetical protein ACRD4L_07245, partial [Pyrinomonadaceae bacterium]
LIWAGLVYVWWYFNSIAFLRNKEVSSYAGLNQPDFPHAGGLREATGWDMVVLAVVIALFLWQFLILIKILRPSYRETTATIRNASS